MHGSLRLNPRKHFRSVVADEVTLDLIPNWPDPPATPGCERALLHSNDVAQVARRYEASFRCFRTFQNPRFFLHSTKIRPVQVEIGSRKWSKLVESSRK